MELDAATTWLDGLPLRGEIVELAAGTGWWSALLATKGELHAYDAAAAPLDRARDRLLAHRLRAHLHVRDAWAAPDRAVDALFAGFWLSHVPRARLVAFLAIVRAWLKPGGAVRGDRLPPGSCVGHRSTDCRHPARTSPGAGSPTAASSRSRRSTTRPTSCARPFATPGSRRRRPHDGTLLRPGRAAGSLAVLAEPDDRPRPTGRSDRAAGDDAEASRAVGYTRRHVAPRRSHPRHRRHRGHGRVHDRRASSAAGSSSPARSSPATRARSGASSWPRTHGIRVTASNVEAVQGADVVLLAVKPQMLARVGREIGPHLAPGQLVLSVIAGATTAALEGLLGHRELVRSMPNTPAQLGRGMTVWYATPETTADQRAQAKALLSALGAEIEVDDEKFVAMATAVSGTGPTYVFLVMEALIDAAVHLGFPRHVAHDLVVETLEGSTLFAKQSGDHPAVLRNMVTSPGGTSAAALHELESGRLRTVLSEAVWAAYRRTVELGDQLEAAVDAPPERRRR